MKLISESKFVERNVLKLFKTKILIEKKWKYHTMIFFVEEICSHFSQVFNKEFVWRRCMLAWLKSSFENRPFYVREIRTWPLFSSQYVEIISRHCISLRNLLFWDIPSRLQDIILRHSFILRLFVFRDCNYFERL